MKEKSITRVSLEEAKNLEDLTDWERLKNMSDEDIEKNAINDPDNQPLPYPRSENETKAVDFWDNLMKS